MKSAETRGTMGVSHDACGETIGSSGACWSAMGKQLNYLVLS